MTKRFISAFAVFGLLISLCGCLKNNSEILDNCSVHPDFKSGFELQCQCGDIIYDFFADFSDYGVLQLTAKGSLPPALEKTSLVLDGKTVKISSGDIEAELLSGQLPEDFIPVLVYDFFSSLSSSGDALMHFEEKNGRYYCRKTFGSKIITLSFPCNMTDKSVYLLEIN